MIALVKNDRVNNLYRYIFYSEPYVNRTFSISHNVLSESKPLFKKIRDNKEFDDRRGHFPDFSLPLSQQVTTRPSVQELDDYEDFLRRYGEIKKSNKVSGKYPSDRVAFRTMGLVNKYYEKNLKNSKNIPKDAFAVESRYRAEDFVYYLVNARTACGTVGEATVALLRGAGFKARLLRFSRKPDPVTANHIFPEFYSKERGSWVMLDPMINASPKGKAGSMSAMEMMADPAARTDMNRRWDGGMNYTRDGVVWFDRKGPQTDIYYFSGAKQTRDKLKRSLGVTSYAKLQ